MRKHMGHGLIRHCVLAGLLCMSAASMAQEPIWTDRPVRIDRAAQPYERIPTAAAPAQAPAARPIAIGKDLKVIDAANFLSGGKAYRIVGLAGLEPNQICRDDRGRRWACGVRSRATLRALLQQTAMTRCLPADREASPTPVTCTHAGRSLADYMIARAIAFPAGD